MNQSPMGKLDFCVSLMFRNGAKKCYNYIRIGIYAKDWGTKEGIGCSSYLVLSNFRNNWKG